MTENVMDKRKKVYSETVHGMTDNVMAKRKKCNQKQYMVWQTIQWLKEKSVIRNSTWYDRQCNDYEKKV
jgi:hypothetical protein